MKLTVAIIILMIKIGIKQQDPGYDLKSFLEDIVSNLGNQVGTEIASLILEAEKSIDSSLSDECLVRIRIPKDRTEATRENTKKILKLTKIDNEMLANYNCDASRVSNSLMEQYARRVGVYEKDCLWADTKAALELVIQNCINIAQQSTAFVSTTAIEIKRIVEESAVIGRGTDRKVDAIIEMLNEQNRKRDELWNRFASQNSDAALAGKGSEKSTNGKNTDIAVDKPTLEVLLAIASEGNKNEKL